MSSVAHLLMLPRSARGTPPTRIVAPPTQLGPWPMRSPGVESHHRAAEGRRILVLCLGGIGDTVLAFSALRDLRRACPEDHLTALTMWPQSKDLLEDLGIFDEVLQHNFQKERYWRSLRTALELRRRCFDVSILAFPANRCEYNIVSRILGAGRRYGHTYLRGGDFENFRFLLTDTVTQIPGRHVVEENRELVARFTGMPPARVAETRLGALAACYHHDAARMLAHLPRPLVGIHPGSSSFKGLTTKRWPVERFGELCHRIEREIGATPVVFGNPDEIDLKLRIQRLCPQIFFAHGPTIRHTAALMSRCSGFVSNDSALAHLAAAAGVPVAMICGPTDGNEVGPYGGRGCVLSADTGCSPCFRVGRQPMKCTHPNFQACLKGVSVGQVLDVVGSFLSSSIIPEYSKVRRETRPQKTVHSLPVLKAAI